MSVNSDDPSVVVGGEETWIARLLDRAGVPLRQRTNFVAQTLDIAYQQARRRLNGETPWLLDEVSRLAASCGESLASLFTADGGSEDGVDAALVVGTLRLPCRAWIGRNATSRPLTPLVAIQPIKDEWTVVTSTTAAGNVAFEVDRLFIRMVQAKRRRVAVLDDDRDLAQSIADYMEITGFDTEAFFTMASYSQSQAAFDGFVIDWLMDTGTTRELIAEIRAKDQSCPIVLLTGQIETGLADEAELAAVASLYRLTCLEKPSRTMSIVSALQSGFDRQGAPEP